MGCVHQTTPYHIPKDQSQQHHCENIKLATDVLLYFIKNNPTRCNNVSKFLLFHIYMKFNMFGRHTTHHQEPKTALAASGFSCVECCLVDAVRHTVPDNVHQLHTPPIIRSLKLHWQPLVFHTWKVVWTCSWWTLSGTVCLTTSTNYTSKQHSTHEKPGAASAVLGS